MEIFDKNYLMGVGCWLFIKEKFDKKPKANKKTTLSSLLILT